MFLLELIRLPAADCAAPPEPPRPQPKPLGAGCRLFHHALGACPVLFLFDSVPYRRIFRRRMEPCRKFADDRAPLQHFFVQLLVFLRITVHAARQPAHDRGGPVDGTQIAKRMRRASQNAGSRIVATCFSTREFAFCANRLRRRRCQIAGLKPGQAAGYTLCS